ncbi:hypothetical protein M8C21_011390, partial [Ambrosia artemisiifolia]
MFVALLDDDDGNPNLLGCYGAWRLRWWRASFTRSNYDLYKFSSVKNIPFVLPNTCLPPVIDAGFYCGTLGGRGCYTM